jgi:hypothetical protein
MRFDQAELDAAARGGIRRHDRFESRRRLQGEPQVKPLAWGFSFALTLELG